MISWHMNTGARSNLLVWELKLPSSSLRHAVRCKAKLTHQLLVMELQISVPVICTDEALLRLLALIPSAASRTTTSSNLSHTPLADTPVEGSGLVDLISTEPNYNAQLESSMSMKKVGYVR